MVSFVANHLTYINTSQCSVDENYATQGMLTKTNLGSVCFVVFFISKYFQMKMILRKMISFFRVWLYSEKFFGKYFIVLCEI